MLSCFIKVMLGFKNELKAITPDAYYSDVYTIDYTALKKQNIDTILFDIDNTLAKVDDLNIPKETQKLIQDLKAMNFKILLISNNYKSRVMPFAKALDLKVLADAGKPAKEAYTKALNILDSNIQSTVAIGDQILTDVVGAKKYGIKAILVDQLSTENNIKTGLAQKLQKPMLKKLGKENLKYHKLGEQQWMKF